MLLLWVLPPLELALDDALELEDAFVLALEPLVVAALAVCVVLDDLDL